MLVFPNEGEVLALELLTAPTLELVLFTNALDESTPVEETFTAASIVEATDYVRPSLTSGGWTITEGDPTTATYPQQGIAFSAVPAAPTITGYALVRASDGRLLCAEVFSDPRVITSAGDVVPVIPRITAS